MDVTDCAYHLLEIIDRKISLTNSSSGIQHARHFWYAVAFVLKCYAEAWSLRASPLNWALCLITKNQWLMFFLCSIGWLVLSLSASWLQWALFSGHLFFGAGNSERASISFQASARLGRLAQSAI